MTAPRWEAAMRMKAPRGDEDRFEDTNTGEGTWVCQWDRCERPAVRGLKKYLPVYRESQGGREVESYALGGVALFCGDHVAEAKRELELEPDVRVQVILKA